MSHNDVKPGAVTDVPAKEARRWCSRGRRVALLSLVGLWGSLGLWQGAVSALPIDYFALGDSVASGHGLIDDGTACRQPMLAYPWLLYARLDVGETWIQYPTDADSNSTPVGGDCFHPNRAGAGQFAEAVTRLVPTDLDLPLRLLTNDSSFAPGDILA